MENKQQKSNKYIDPSNAIFNIEKELIIDHIDLGDELVAFLSEQTSNKDEALEYLENTQPKMSGTVELLQFSEYSDKQK